MLDLNKHKIKLQRSKYALKSNLLELAVAFRWEELQNIQLVKHRTDYLNLAVRIWIETRSLIHPVSWDMPAVEDCAVLHSDRLRR